MERKQKPDNFRKRQYYPTLERLGMRKLNPHCTRHTFITRAVKQGVDMDELLRLVGHVDKETTQLYLHDDGDTIRNIVKRVR
ncbi:tyrosine-type recombinase/integrase [Oscillibacter sp.]